MRFMIDTKITAGLIFTCITLDFQIVALTEFTVKLYYKHQYEKTEQTENGSFAHCDYDLNETPKYNIYT